MGIYYGLEIYGIKILKTDPYTERETILYERLFENATREIKEEVTKEYNKIEDFTNIHIYFYKEYTCSYEFDLEPTKTWVKSVDSKEIKNILID
jgi:hypothetical protein